MAQVVRFQPCQASGTSMLLDGTITRRGSPGCSVGNNFQSSEILLKASAASTRVAQRGTRRRSLGVTGGGSSCLWAECCLRIDLGRAVIPQERGSEAWLQQGPCCRRSRSSSRCCDSSRGCNVRAAADPESAPGPVVSSELELNRWRLKPVEEKYRIVVERGISEKRKEELGIASWPVWASPGPCAYMWEWRTDEQVYITRGTLRVTPEGCEGSAKFKEGDLVRFPKWLYAELEFGGNYEQHYRFRAYGDDH